MSYRRDAWTNYSRSNDIPEHLPILRALLAGNAEGATVATDRHIRSAARIVEEVAFAEPPPGAAARTRSMRMITGMRSEKEQCR